MNCATLTTPVPDDRRQVGDQAFPEPHPSPAVWPRCADASCREGIRALLIFPSGVLYDDTLWWRWLSQLLARMGLHTHSSAFRALWLREYYTRVCRGEQNYWDALRAFLLAAGLSRGQFDEVWAAGRPRWRMYRKELRPFPHVPAALASLKASGCTISVFAQSPETGNQLAERYERMGIRCFLDEVCTSRDFAELSLTGDEFELAIAHMCQATETTAIVSHESCFAWASGSIALPSSGPLRIAVGLEADVPADLHVAGLAELPQLVFDVPRRVATCVA